MGTPTVVKATPAPPSGPNVQSLLGPLKFSAFTFTFSSSYATGGETFDPATTNPFEVKSVIGVFVIPPANATVDVVWDPAGKKLKAYWLGPALSGVKAEVANTTNLSVTPGALTVIVLHR
jgi:hypothetical protein